METSQKIVLCRPQGGLNDMLCQIEHCCRYGEKSRRQVVVDTAYPEAEYFRDTLSHYFESLQRRLSLDAEPFAAALRTDSVYPESLTGRLHEYRAIRDYGRQIECEIPGGQPLMFDANRDYPHQVVLHHQCGGGNDSIYALMRMRLTQPLGRELLRRLRELGPAFDGVHVRHTDYHTNYAPLLERLMAMKVRRVFVATDNARVLTDFRSALGPGRVFSFASLPEQAGRPVHRRLDFVAPDEVRRRNEDAILDLLMLALSTRLHLSELVANRNRAQYSGFSNLARNLWSAKVSLKPLLGHLPMDFGLG